MLVGKGEGDNDLPGVVVIHTQGYMGSQSVLFELSFLELLFFGGKVLQGNAFQALGASATLAGVIHFRRQKILYLDV